MDWCFWQVVAKQTLQRSFMISKIFRNWVFLRMLVYLIWKMGNIFYLESPTIQVDTTFDQLLFSLGNSMYNTVWEDSSNLFAKWLKWLSLLRKLWSKFRLWSKKYLNGIGRCLAGFQASHNGGISVQPVRSGGKSCHSRLNA